jgi:hypothetical protein
MEEIAKLKKGATSERYLQAMRDPAFDLIRDLPFRRTCSFAGSTISRST